MARGEGLTPFKKGSKAASEAGKKSKRGVSLVTTLKNKLDKNPELKEELIAAMIEHAKEGNGAYMKMVMEYIDGKVKDQVELTGKDGGPIETKEVKYKFVGDNRGKTK